ncbi:MAG: hypothetical protein Q4C85_08495 [Actinomyces sp.]|uniref:hypothetical protein n=1 Tax=Actinomyces sp. TaxID=29317 RepID=UPI0026DAD2CB|nr:hypothetical protein [Actinomyces sp.]MDO4243776.1 hypothetical protein [Actinomyces sp.]
MEWSASWLPVTHVASVGEPRLVGPTLERAAELEQPPHWVCDVARLCRGSQAHVAAAVEPAILSREGVEALVSAPGTCRRCVEEARRLLAETAPEVSGEDPLGTPSMLDMLAAREGGDPR